MVVGGKCDSRLSLPMPVSRSGSLACMCLSALTRERAVGKGMALASAEHNTTVCRICKLRVRPPQGGNAGQQTNLLVCLFSGGGPFRPDEWFPEHIPKRLQEVIGCDLSMRMCQDNPKLRSRREEPAGQTTARKSRKAPIGPRPLLRHWASGKIVSILAHL